MRGTIEVTLPDGRRCGLVAHQRPPTEGVVARAAPLVVRCEIAGEEPFDVAVDAAWEETARLPAGLADLIIRHFLLC